MDINFTSLWFEFNRPIENFIRRRVRNEQDADDILQDVFCKINGKMDKLMDDDKIQAWIYKITRNTIVDYYRKRVRTFEFTELTEDLTNGMEEDLSVNEEIAMCLRTMVDRLPEKYKQAITLSQFQNLKQKEMADKLGISLSGAKSRVQRGKMMLKETFLGCCNLEFDSLGNIVDYKHKTKDCKFC